jgi:DNA topoisomerase IA
MIMQHKPDLVAESFNARTEREFDQISTRGAVEYDYLVNMYREYIQQHIKDAKP